MDGDAAFCAHCGQPLSSSLTQITPEPKEPTDEPEKIPEGWVTGYTTHGEITCHFCGNVKSRQGAIQTTIYRQRQSGGIKGVSFSPFGGNIVKSVRVHVGGISRPPIAKQVWECYDCKRSEYIEKAKAGAGGFWDWISIIGWFALLISIFPAIFFFSEGKWQFGILMAVILLFTLVASSLSRQAVSNKAVEVERSVSEFEKRCGRV